MSSIDVRTDLLDPAKFTGRAALITGGSSGIGLETAQILLSRGCNVMIGDIRPPEEMEDLKTLSTAENTVRYEYCDITDWNSLYSLFEKTVAAFGRIDIVHANAGINDVGDAFYSTELDSTGRLREPSHKTIDINVKATANTVTLGIYFLRRNPEGGSLIMTASLAGYFPTEGMPLYTASKHALVGLLRTLTPSAKALGISISLVAPGMTETPLLGSLPGLSVDSSSKTELQAIWGQLKSSGVPAQGPDVVARAVCYLIGQGIQAAGQGLFVQGGEVFDIEAGLAKARPAWLSQRMGYLLKGDGAVWE